MAKYPVKSRLIKDGKSYPPGTTVELATKEAATPLIEMGVLGAEIKESKEKSESSGSGSKAATKITLDPQDDYFPPALRHA